MITVYIDGSCKGNPGPKGAGIVICESGESTRLSYHLGHGTNNEAEYQALIIALNELKGKESEQITICSDSKLIVNQVTGKWKAGSHNIKPLHYKARTMFRRFPKIKMRYIERAYNYEADSLANEGADNKDLACFPLMKDLQFRL